MIWRTGRKVGRTIYLQKKWEPSDGDQLIGVMDTVELAERVVNTINMNESLIKALEAEIIDLKNTVIQRDAEIAKIEKVNAESVQALDELRSRMADRISAHEEIRQERDKWVREAQKAGVLGRKAADMEWKQRLDKETAEWRKVVDRQEAELQSRQNLINERDTKIVELEEQLAQYAASNKELSDSHNAVLRRVAREPNSYAEENDKLRQENDILSKEIAEKDFRIQHLEADRDHVSRQRDAYKDNVAKLTEESSANSVNSFTKNGVARIQQMIAELDTALHGVTLARDQTPQEVWKGLLEEIKIFKASTKHHSAGGDFAKVLNYWGYDTDLNMPDFIVANHLVRYLSSLTKLQRDVKDWKN